MRWLKNIIFDWFKNLWNAQDNALLLEEAEHIIERTGKYYRHEYNKFKRMLNQLTFKDKCMNLILGIRNEIKSRKIKRNR